MYICSHYEFYKIGGHPVSVTDESNHVYKTGLGTGVFFISHDLTVSFSILFRITLLDGRSDLGSDVQTSLQNPKR